MLSVCGKKVLNFEVDFGICFFMTEFFCEVIKVGPSFEILNTMTAVHCRSLSSPPHARFKVFKRLKFLMLRFVKKIRISLQGILKYVPFRVGRFLGRWMVCSNLSCVLLSNGKRFQFLVIFYWMNSISRLGYF